MKKEYGIFLGRFQPFHLAHQLVVNEILNKDLNAILLIGDSGKQDSRNPFTFEERANAIYKIYDHFHAVMNCLKVIDFPESDQDWIDNIVAILNAEHITPKQCEVFIHVKDGDIGCNNNRKLFKKAGFKITDPYYHSALSLIVNATDIRNDLEANKHFLHPIIYKKCKNRLLK